MKDYDFTFSKFDPHTWHKMISPFKDQCVYQLPSYINARWSSNNYTHLLIKDQKNIIRASGQFYNITFPPLPMGIAYLYRGPMWRIHSTKDDLEYFKIFIRTFKTEYGDKKKFYLRIVPNITDNLEYSEEVMKILEEEGFRNVRRGGKTFLLNFSLTLDELRSSMRRKWRQTLKHSEKTDFTVEHGRDISLFDEILLLYNEMQKRKGFTEFVDINTFRFMQTQLPIENRFQIFVCRLNGIPVAGAAFSDMGDTILPIIFATGIKGLKNNASYFLWWNIIKHFKNEKYAFLDLGGINRERNPGGYTFKSGLAGKRGIDTRYIGEFDYSSNFFTYLMFTAIDRTNILRKGSKLFVEKLRKR